MPGYFTIQALIGSLETDQQIPAGSQIGPNVFLMAQCLNHVFDQCLSSYWHIDSVEQIAVSLSGHNKRTFSPQENY